MKIYVKAYWYDDEDSADDFIYGPDNSADVEQDDLPYEVISDDPYLDNISYGDFDDYDQYGYSEYEDFYNQIKRRTIYVPARVARDIPDYNAYRKALFNTLYLSMKTGETIESLYNEFCSAYPGIVKGGFLAESDMLLELVDATLYAQSILQQH